MTEQEQAVIDAAVAWFRACGPYGPLEDGDTPLSVLAVAVGALLEPLGPRTDQARPMTWGTVPAGWYVQVPRTNDWFQVTATERTWDKTQKVTLDISGQPFTHPRDPQGAVTACLGPPNATDAAIEVLGFPEILEDRS